LGVAVPVQSLRELAVVIVGQRSSIFQMPAADRGDIHPPGKNSPQAFYKRHPELKAVRVKTLDWERHDRYIYDKVVDWFTAIGKELNSPLILPENVYNMDDTGLLSILNSLKVLVGKNELRNYRGAGVKRTLITAIECISADGRYLHLLIVWPAATHRSTWTVHPTPGWHFGHTETGYTDTAISLFWMQHVFDPLTKDRAKDRPGAALTWLESSTSRSYMTKHDVRHSFVEIFYPVGLKQGCTYSIRIRCYRISKIQSKLL
jgi:DDE superfamily endonuclease